MRIWPLITWLALFAVASSCASKSDADKTPEEKRADLYYGHGTENLLEKDYTSALEYLLKAQELMPNDSRVHNNLGMAYFFKSQPDKALSHLQRAVKLDEKNSEARNNLAALYFHTHRYPEAREQYSAVLSDLIYKHQYRTHYNIALIDLKQGNMQEAIHSLDLSLKDNPDYCPASFQLGGIAFSRYEYAKAIEFYKKSSTGPCYNNPAPHYQEAMALLKLNRGSEAAVKFREIMEKFPTSPYSIAAGKQLIRTGSDSQFIEPIQKQAAPAKKRNEKYDSVQF
jgi:Tfp pilus assembly protein PilF